MLIASLSTTTSLHPKPGEPKHRFWVEVYRISMRDHLIGRAYHRYDSHPLVWWVSKRLERAEQWWRTRTGRADAWDIPWTNRQDLRCHELNYDKRTLLHQFEIDEATYEQLCAKAKGEP